MGLMSKFKNMFTEEIEEEPIRKEVIQVEIPAPVKAEKEAKTDDSLGMQEEIKTKSDNGTTREKKEDKFTFPVFFDDKDFDTLEKPKREHKPERKVEPYGGAKKLETPKEKPRVFKPTPVISPIYGVLDKNYKKEDITARKETPCYKENHTINVDDIRKKAYGTLEDDLENTLLHDDFYDDESSLYKSEKDMFDDFDLLDDTSMNKKEDNLMDFDFPLPEHEKSRLERNQKEIEEDIVAKEINQKEIDSKKEADDLFDLIDSMYEKGE